MTQDLTDLAAFVTVARAGGFREAARAGGGSASRLSEAVRRLESGLGVRLLNRTTRSVSLTEAGDRLSATLRPALDSIATELASLGDLRDRLQRRRAGDLDVGGHVFLTSRL